MLRNLFWNLGRGLNCAGEIFRYLRIFLWALFSPKAVLAARLLAVESQLAVCKLRIQQKKDPRPRFTSGFRFLWILLSQLLDRWEDLTPPHAAGNCEEVAHHGLSLLLALEVSAEGRSTVNSPGNAGPDPQTEP